jgi:transposase-like protein
MPKGPDDRGQITAAELLAKAGNDDFLRSVAEAVVQLLMETDVEGMMGAGWHERTGDRQTYRNGYVGGSQVSGECDGRRSTIRKAVDRTAGSRMDKS